MDDDLSLLDRLYAPDNGDMNYKYEKSVQYLVMLKEPERIMTDARAYRVIRFLRDSSEDNDDLVTHVLAEKGLVEIFTNIIAFYREEVKTFLTSYSRQSKVKLSEDDENRYLEEFDFIEELIYLMRNLTNKSKSLCYRFHDNKGTLALLSYLNDDNLVKRLVRFKQRSSSSSVKEIGFHFIRGLLGTLLNISYIADYRKQDFEDLQATEVIIKFIGHIKQNADARLLAFVTLTNIVNESDIETLLDTNQAIEDIVNLIRIGVDAISEKENLKRIRVDIDFDEGNEVFEDVCIINADWNILDLLLALYRLAVNDKYKSVIYEDFNVKIELQKLFSYGNDTEKEYGAKLLWQLCFDKSIAKKVQEAELLYAYIQDLAERDVVKSKHLKRYCKGIIWSVSRYEQNVKLSEMNRNAAEILVRSLVPTMQLHSANAAAKTGADGGTQKATKGKHIMISYNSQSREDCLKIKAELEKLGHTIWIDVEDISGSSLEAMANAIQNSICVLMCMSEKYKQSPNCRAEAEYAFRLGVPIIPLIMQVDYMPDGWLGIILGSKIFVNFKKYPFEECMRRLLLELRAMDVQPVKTTIESQSVPASALPFKPTAIVDQQQQTTTAGKVDIKNWSTLDVQNWCKKFSFNSEITKMLKNFNGELLIQLNETKKQSSDYFYKEISQKNKLDLHSVVNFVNEFQKLFK